MNEKAKKTLITVLTAVAGCAIAAGILLLISGKLTEPDTPSSKAGESEEETMESSTEKAELAVSDAILKDGGMVLSFTEKDGLFGVQVSEDGKGAAFSQAEPARIQVKHPNEAMDFLGKNVRTELLTSGYQKLYPVENGILAEAVLTSEAGSEFRVSDTYTVSENGGFFVTRGVEVLSAMGDDEGFNSLISFHEEEPQTYDHYEYFVPGILYRNESHLGSTSIGANLGLDYVWALDTHTCLPYILARNTENGYGLSLGRVIEGKVETGIDESNGMWVVDESIEYGSIGFSNVNGYVSLDLCYPGMEGNICYLDATISFARRSHPVEVGFKQNYKALITLNHEEMFTTAAVNSYEAHYEAAAIPEVDIDIDKVYAQTLDLFKNFTQEYTYGRTGMPFAIGLDGSVTSLDQLIGFVGQQTSVGFHLIRDGYLNDDAAERQKGIDVIETWVYSCMTEYGFPRVWYVTAGGHWAPNSFIISYVRYMSDGMEGILDAYLEEKAHGVEKADWIAVCKTYADWLVSAQAEDGSWPRAYNPDTGEAGQSEDGRIHQDTNNTSVSVRYLIRMYEQTGEARYFDSAVKAGEYVYQHGFLTDNFYGGTPDQNNKIDKEASIFAWYAFDALYMATGDEKWLGAAEYAAVSSGTFIYTFDFTVMGDEKYNIYRDLIGTSGMSRISTGASAVDPFGAYLYYEYYKLYLLTGRGLYYDMAKLIQDNSRQAVNVDGYLPFAYNGIVNEAHNISNMYISSDVELDLTWCNIAIIDPIGLMQDTFGVSTIEEAEALGKEEALKRLKEFGTGGNFR